MAPVKHNSAPFKGPLRGTCEPSEILVEVRFWKWIREWAWRHVRFMWDFSIDIGSTSRILQVTLPDCPRQVNPGSQAAVQGPPQRPTRTPTWPLSRAPVVYNSGPFAGLLLSPAVAPLNCSLYIICIIQRLGLFYLFFFLKSVDFFIFWFQLRGGPFWDLWGTP